MKVKIAAVQMDVRPAPAPERLERAARLVEQAAINGARLVVLPELFNTGYEYSSQNFQRAERLDGPTVSWMKSTAGRLGVHLAGSLLLWDAGDIFNALLLIAPDGEVWRYYKNYPWGWERAYFRSSRGITIAHTALGDIGFMVCWDVAHPGLWRQYAGLVDLMIICSSPPDITNPVYCFPDGSRVTIDAMGAIMHRLRDTGELAFGAGLDRQAAWLQVPAVNSMACGRFESQIPQAQNSLLALVPTAPRLVKYVNQSAHMRLSCPMIDACKIVDGHGISLARRRQEQGEGLVCAEVDLPARRAAPGDSQPASPLPWAAYLVSDWLLPGLVRGYYRREVRKARDRNPC